MSRCLSVEFQRPSDAIFNIKEEEEKEKKLSKFVFTLVFLYDTVDGSEKKVFISGWRVMKSRMTFKSSC
jgi:hypothetical protein